MKKIICLTMAFGLVCIGLLTGCNNQDSSTPPATPPATNAPAH
jgi:hypothetical protein